MSLYRRQDNTNQLATLNDELRLWNKWKQLLEDHSWFVEYLQKAMEETMIAPDVDVDFRSVRSKFQTLKALRDMIIKSKEEVNWRQQEIGKLEKLK